MANTSVPVSQIPLNIFRVGRILDRTLSVYTQNFLSFSLIMLIAWLPAVAMTGNSAFDPFDASTPAPTNLTAIYLLLIVSLVLFLFSLAVVVHASFQSMRGRAVNLRESVTAALSRIIPIFGIVVMFVLTFLIFAFIVGLVPTAIMVMARNTAAAPVFILLAIGVVVFMFVVLLALLTRWFAAISVCMVERTGPVRSLVRSSQLTKGHRWKVFGFVLMYVGASILGQFISLAVAAVGGQTVVLIFSLAWSAITGAFFAILAVVTYYELRSSKEGVDIDQIASVFD